MTTNTYDKGDTIRLTAEFTSNLLLTDPTTITLKVKPPSGVISSYTFAANQVYKSYTGTYYRDISIDQSGIWYYRFEGTGAVAAAGENQFEARKSEF